MHRQHARSSLDNCRCPLSRNLLAFRHHFFSGRFYLQKSPPSWLVPCHPVWACNTPILTYIPFVSLRQETCSDDDCFLTLNTCGRPSKCHLDIVLFAHTYLFCVYNPTFYFIGTQRHRQYPTVMILLFSFFFWRVCLQNVGGKQNPYPEIRN